MSCKRVPIILILLCAIMNTANSTPMLNIQDPAIIHTVYGTDTFANHLNHSRLTFNFSPYYQHASSASKAGQRKTTGGKKVSIGNVDGPWNMAAIYFNEAPPARANLAAFNSGKAALQSAAVTAQVLKNLSLENIFDLEHGKFDSVVTYDPLFVKYEKMGLRGQASFDLGFGLGLNVKGGVTDYRQIPKFNLNKILKKSLSGGGGDDDATPQINAAASKEVFDKLMSQNARNAIAKELGLDFTEQHRTDFEDVHVSIYWNLPFKMYDKDEHVLTVAPRFSVGAWLPFSQDLDHDKAFSLSVGNEGYAGVTTQASVSLDFPGSIQVVLGGGVEFFTSQEFSEYRVPTSIHQVGIIPWKTKVSRTPGPIWYANLSLKAENFSPGFSGFFDYVYTEHTRDEFTIKEPNRQRRAKFLPKLLEERSAWRCQHINAGVQYALTKHFLFGLAVQGTVTGMRTYRTTTVLGSLIAIF